jgi:pyruvate-formate lyase
MSGNWGKIEDTRMWAFREEILNTPQSLCAERAVLYTEAHRKHRNEQTAVLRAYCLKNILENMTIYIEDKTLLVGNQASVNRAAPVFIECAVDWLIEELDDIEKRDGDRFVVPDKEKERIRMLAPYWENNSLKDKALAAFPEKTRLYYDLGIIKSEGNITAGDGHLAVNYLKIIQLGLSDFKQRAKEALAKLDITNYEQLKKSYFYKGVLIVLDAVIQFSHRYADLAEKMAETEQNHLRIQTLLQ